MLNMSSQMQARGQPGGFGFPGVGNGPGGFTLPGGLGDRFASVFPPAGMQGQQQNQQPQAPQGRETSETGESLARRGTSERTGYEPP